MPVRQTSRTNLLCIYVHDRIITQSQESEGIQLLGLYKDLWLGFHQIYIFIWAAYLPSFYNFNVGIQNDDNVSCGMLPAWDPGLRQTHLLLVPYFLYESRPLTVDLIYVFL